MYASRIHVWLRYIKVIGLVLGLQSGNTKYPYFLSLWDSRADDQHYVRQEWLLKQGLKPGSHNIQSHPLIKPKYTASTRPYQVRKYEELCEDSGQGRQWFCFPSEVPTVKHVETQGWYIWRPSKKRTHEGPNIWRSTERSWTIHRAATEVSSYKLPEEAPECGIRKRNWRYTEDFPPTRGTNVCQTALSVKSKVSTFTNTFELWKSATKGCKLSRWLLLVLETGCSGCRTQKKVPENTFHPWIASFVYFSVYCGTMWAFCEYINTKFNIICFIQQENI